MIGTQSVLVPYVHSQGPCMADYSSPQHLQVGTPKDHDATVRIRTFVRTLLLASLWDISTTRSFQSTRQQPLSSPRPRVSSKTSLGSVPLPEVEISLLPEPRVSCFDLHCNKAEVQTLIIRVTLVSNLRSKIPQRRCRPSSIRRVHWLLLTSARVRFGSNQPGV